jgi:hypothetical protein
MLNVLLRHVIFAECHHTECHFADCHFADCHFAECHFPHWNYAEYQYVICPHAECHHAVCLYAKSHCAECCYAECHYAECHGTISFILRFQYQISLERHFFVFFNKIQKLKIIFDNLAKNVISKLTLLRVHLHWRNRKRNIT